MGGTDCAEELNTHLLDERLNLVGAAHVAWAYAKGDFVGISIGEPSTIYFRFSDKLCWRVRMFARQRWVIPSLRSTASSICCPFEF